MIDLMTKLDAIFAKNLVATRKAKGYLSAESLAEALEISLRSLQRYESGERMPASDKIELIAEKLGVPVQDFFKVDEPAIVLDKATPMSSMLKQLSAIPDEAYEMFRKIPPGDAGKEIWGLVEITIKNALIDLEEAKEEED